MDNQANQPGTSGTTWKPSQTYAMTAVCLVIGVIVGYLLRGSAAPAPPPAATTTAAPIRSASSATMARAFACRRASPGARNCSPEIVARAIKIARPVPAIAVAAPRAASRISIVGAPATCAC